MQGYVIALYIRLSVEDYKYDSLSIENQRLMLHEYVLSLPEAEGAEVLEFVDNGYSGANFERPQVQALIEQVRENKIDCIIVKDFSRFGRNSIETGYFIERVFPLFHTRFISVGDSFDSDRLHGDTGGLDVAFKYLINEWYSRDMSIKTKSAKYAKMQRGEYQSKICPYGYLKGASGRLEPDPEAAAVVRQIFQLAAGGMSAAAIIRELYRQNIPTPGEYKAARGNTSHDISRTRGVWCTSTVLHILEDERYIGTYVIGKRSVIEVGGNRSRIKDRDKWYIIPDHHQPIVDGETFRQAQEAVRRNPGLKKKVRTYPLRGKVFCGCCGHALARTSGGPTKYYCRYAEVSEDLSCHGLRVDAGELERAVLDTLQKQMDVIAEPGKDAAACLSALQTRQAEYQAQAEVLQDGKRRLYERFLLGELDLDAYKAEKAGLDARLIRLENAYAALKAQLKREQEREARQAVRQTAEKELSEVERLTRTLDELLVEKVLVFPDKRVEIRYKTTFTLGKVLSV